MQNKVTIVILTYNHELFIRDALENAVQQVAPFAFKVLLMDDCSSDSTLAIAAEIASKYPGKIQIETTPFRLGVLKNIKRAIPLLDSEYWAICDGDDFWTDKQKIEKQVVFLEKNLDYNGVFHDTQIVHCDADTERVFFYSKKKYSEIYDYPDTVFPSDLIKRLILPSSSVLCRNNFEKDGILSLMLDDYSLLWKLSCVAIKESKFHYMPEVMSTYRNHKNGISKKAGKNFHISHIRFLNNLLNDSFYKNYRLDIYTSICNEYSIILNTSSNLGKNEKRFYLKKHFFAEMHRLWHFRKSILK